MIDILIIGAGGAGLSSALYAKERDLSIKVVSKTLPTQSQSVMAQGGINAALGNVESDSIESHIEDTLKASHSLASSDMVSKLCKGGIDTIKYLESIGVPFSRIEGASEPIKSIAQRRLGGASSKRACYAQDYTGLKIIHTLYDQAIKRDIDIEDNLILLELLKSGNRVLGGVFYDISTATIKTIRAKATILATGGFGGVYHSYTTNMFSSSGDGLVAILRAGGRLRNIEFVQFHPTALKGSSVLISESARGEGGYLIDEDGNRFVDELLPRDEVARAIFRKIDEGKSVYLDIRHFGIEKIKHLMPQELHLCQLFAGVDPSKEPIPISPAVHYTMGGIAVDSNLQVEGLEGCYAVGECSESGVHGANRLGGNSLLEITTLPRYAIDSIVESLSDIDKTEEPYDISLPPISKNESIYDIRRELGDMLFKKVGIIRDEEGLDSALEELKSLKERFKSAGVSDISAHSLEVVEYFELKSALEIAEALILSARLRQESRGSHFRADYPKENPNLAKASLCYIDDNAQIGVEI